MLRLTTFAPVSTAYAIAAATSKSVNIPSELALIVVSPASPAIPAMPLPFERACRERGDEGPVPDGVADVA